MVNERYNALLIKEKGRWTQKSGELVPCGQCQFCGTRSMNGYVIQSDDNRIMLVGTSCVFILCNLTKEQQRVIKYNEARIKHARKYSQVVEYLKAHHKVMRVRESWHKLHDTHDEITKHYMNRGIPCIEVKCIDNKTGNPWSITNYSEASWNEKETQYCQEGSISDNSNQEYIAALIISKILGTTKVNDYWWEQYKKLTGIDLRKEVRS